MRSFRQFLWRTVRRLLILLLIAALAYHAWIGAHIWWWIKHNPSSTAFMDTRLEHMQDRDPKAELLQHWVPYDEISPHLKRALIAAEDAKFVDHEGFDWQGIALAIEKNRKKGKIVAGGSTISQQLAKNLFLSTRRSPWRKGEEAIITVMLEQMMEKRRIFDIYLNTIEWGDGIFGAEAAARHYFNIHASELSQEQAARLAAMVPNPRFYDRHRDTPGLTRKIAIILENMERAETP